MYKPSVAVQIASYFGLAEFPFDNKMNSSREAVGGLHEMFVATKSSGENLPAADVDQFYKECVRFFRRY